MNFWEIVHPDYRERVKEIGRRRQEVELGVKEYEIKILAKDGAEKWIELSSASTHVNGRPGGIVSMTDFTARKQAEARVEHMATHDGLTDLPSLRLANDRLTMALAMSRRQKREGAVLFMDLDGFKQVNDTLGHDAGDHVLRQVGRRMQECVRETDTVARIGGDEFLIVAYGLNMPSDAVTIAEKILRTVSRPILYQGREATVGASIGIATFPTHGYDREKLLKLADEAMYQVKSSGKNGYRFARLGQPAGVPAEALERTS
jgi:diguanylate cyclase (GGDEF)-like protein